MRTIPFAWETSMWFEIFASKCRRSRRFVRVSSNRAGASSGAGKGSPRFWLLVLSCAIKVAIH